MQSAQIAITRIEVSRAFQSLLSRDEMQCGEHGKGLEQDRPVSIPSQQGWDASCGYVVALVREAC